MIASRRSLSQIAFAARIDNLTEAAITNGAVGFAALLHRLPGVYPTELLASLNRLAVDNIIDPSLAASIRRQAAHNCADTTEGRSLLPLPHPPDYEWRFTPDAARSLLNHAADLTPVGGDLLLFGTPGLAVEALTAPMSRCLSFLAESNTVTNRVVALNRATGAPLSIAFCSGGLPRESADAVLLDPPSYPDFLRPMLAAAAHACHPGGVVLISLPPDGARPSAEATGAAPLLSRSGSGSTWINTRHWLSAMRSPSLKATPWPPSGSTRRRSGAARLGRVQDGQHIDEAAAGFLCSAS